MRLLLIFIGSLLLIVAVAIVITPRPPEPSAPPSRWRPHGVAVSGAFHVHTDRSPDSSASIDDAAAAAGRAGLQFVVATEHGDGTRAPRPPAYRAGVLWIDGVEISTADGHYATFGMEQAPYPLAGEARDVAADVARLGGTGVAAHGDSARSEAQWRDWNAPIDGLEWLNLDSVWREAGAGKLARAAFTYWFRPSATLDSLASRPTQTLAHLDDVAARRRVFTLAASDAHGRRIPSYDACFGAFSTRVELDKGLTGNAAADADAIIAALRAGHHYTVMDALAKAAPFEFAARAGNATFNEGDVVPEGQPITFDMHADGPPNARTVLLRNGIPLEESQSPAWSHGTEGTRAEYRVEVTLPSSPGNPPVPWIVSNPIYVGSVPASPPAAVHDPLGASPPLEWRTEKDARTVADVAGSGGSIVLRYKLAGGTPANQFAAAVAPAPTNLSAAGGVAFTVRASRPLRFSFELRAHGDRRWQRSVYADTIPRGVVVAFDDMRPVQPNTAAHAAPPDVESLLLLVGITNTAPGTDANVAFSDITLLAR